MKALGCLVTSNRNQFWVFKRTHAHTGWTTGLWWGRGRGFWKGENQEHHVCFGRQHQAWVRTAGAKTFSVGVLRWEEEKLWPHGFLDSWNYHFYKNLRGRTGQPLNEASRLQGIGKDPRWQVTMKKHFPSTNTASFQLRSIPINK